MTTPPTTTSSTYYIVQKRGCGGVEDPGPPVDCLRLFRTRGEGEQFAKLSAENYNARIFYGYCAPEIRESINDYGYRSYTAPGETFHLLFSVREVQVQISSSSSPSSLVDDEPCWAVVTDNVIGGTGLSHCTHIVNHGRVFSQAYKQEAMERARNLARDVCNDDISRYDVYSDEGDVMLTIEDRDIHNSGEGQPQEGKQFITALHLEVVSAQDPNYVRENDSGDEESDDSEFYSETAVTFRVLEIPRGPPPPSGNDGLLDWLEFPSEPPANIQKRVADRTEQLLHELKEAAQQAENSPEPERFRLSRQLMAIGQTPANEQE